MSNNSLMNFAVPSFDNYNSRIMKYGDLVILYEGHESLDHIYLTKDEILNNKFGSFPHKDFVGKPFGSKIFSHNRYSYIFALKCTPELWCLAIHTRTQIVNELDSSIVVCALDLFPGCVVAESGTGSGCMTLAMARAISPTGHVFTYEYNATRASIATEEFKRLNVGHLITVQCHDVCENVDAYKANELMKKDSSNDLQTSSSDMSSGGFLGFHQDNSVDAIFLDLPEPWRALKYARKILKPGRHLCTYSPCIEQVMKACDKLRELGFYGIKMFEVRQIPNEGKSIVMENADIGQPCTEEVKEVNAASVKDTAVDTSKKRKVEEEVVEETTGENGSTRNYIHYKPRTNLPKVTVGVTKPDVMMKGHTAYLTFATCPSKC